MRTASKRKTEVSLLKCNPHLLFIAALRYYRVLGILTSLSLHRKGHDTCAYTILINNMRLMAILEWWERAHHFLTQPPLPPSELSMHPHPVRYWSLTL